MKKLLFILPCLLIIFSSYGQETSTSIFTKGQSNIGLGFGIGGAYGIGRTDSQSPAFGLHFDHGIAGAGGGTIGVGGFVGYKTLSNKYLTYKETFNYFIIGARGTFHYDLFEVDNLDTYGGVMIAYYALNYKNNIPSIYYYDRNYNGNVFFSIMAGAKYYFTPNVAAFGEVGYGVSWLTLGVSFKF